MGYIPYLPQFLAWIRAYYMAQRVLPRLNEVPVDLRIAAMTAEYNGLVAEWEACLYLESKGITVSYDVDEDLKGVDFRVMGYPVQVSTYDKGLANPKMYYLELPGFEDELTDEYKRNIDNMVTTIRARLAPPMVVTFVPAATAVEAPPAVTKRKRGPRKNGKVITYSIDQIAQ